MAGPAGLPLAGYEGWPTPTSWLRPGSERRRACSLPPIPMMIVMILTDAAYCSPVLKGSKTVTVAHAGGRRSYMPSLWPLIERTYVLLTGRFWGSVDEVALCELLGGRLVAAIHAGLGWVVRVLSPCLRAFHGLQPSPRPPGPLQDRGQEVYCSRTAWLIAVSIVDVSAHFACWQPDAWADCHSAASVLNSCLLPAARCTFTKYHIYGADMPDQLV